MPVTQRDFGSFNAAQHLSEGPNQDSLDQVVAYDGVVRASTNIALAEQIPYRTLPLVQAAARLDGDGAPRDRSEPG